MATETQIQRKTAEAVESTADSTEQLLQDLDVTHTKPLWAQMSKLNPPAPNPGTIPFVWRYDLLRPYLLRAGNLVSEKQAERRVLMLVNPAKGKDHLLNMYRYYELASTKLTDRRTAHHGHHLCRPPISNAQRDSSCASSHCVRNAFHHRRKRRFHSSPWTTYQNATRRRYPNANMELARSRKGRLGPHDLAGWT